MGFKGKHTRRCIIKYTLNFRTGLFYILIISYETSGDGNGIVH
jgi:hypothetical protein